MQYALLFLKEQMRKLLPPLQQQHELAASATNGDDVALPEKRPTGPSSGAPSETTPGDGSMKSSDEDAAAAAAEARARELQTASTDFVSQASSQDALRARLLQTSSAEAETAEAEAAAAADAEQGNSSVVTTCSGMRTGDGRVIAGDEDEAFIIEARRAAVRAIATQACVPEQRRASVEGGGGGGDDATSPLPLALEQQGDVDLYTEAALATRAALRRDPSVEKAIGRLWSVDELRRARATRADERIGKAREIMRCVVCARENDASYDRGYTTPPRPSPSLHTLRAAGPKRTSPRGAVRRDAAQSAPAHRAAAV